MFCCGRDTSTRTLAVSQPNAVLTQRAARVTWNGEVSSQKYHLFVNESKEALKVYWLSGSSERCYGNLPPAESLYVGTYSFHVWRVKGPHSKMICEVTGVNATVYIAQDLQAAITFTDTPNVEERDLETADESRGQYRERAGAYGIPVMAFDCVCNEAVAAAASIIGHMLEDSPAWLQRQMTAAGTRVAVIGRDQVVTDIPPHRFMKHHVGRDLDASARGLGGTAAVPTTSAGEENLLMLSGQKYWCQSVLVHEFGHAVLNLGLDPVQVARVCRLYKAARKRRTYPQDCYMMSNEQEYWATAVEAWFESTSRTDVNAGINTRQKLRQVDPDLGEMLELVFGDGDWRFHQEYPITAHKAK